MNFIKKNKFKILLSLFFIIPSFFPQQTFADNVNIIGANGVRFWVYNNPGEELNVYDRKVEKVAKDILKVDEELLELTYDFFYEQKRHNEWYETYTRIADRANKEIAQNSANLILEQTSVKMNNFIKDGFNTNGSDGIGNPAYVRDQQDFLNKTDDRQISLMVYNDLNEEATADNKCGNIIKNTGAVIGEESPRQKIIDQLECTLTAESSDKIESWEDFLSYNQPQNNPMGALTITNIELDLQREEAKTQVTNELSQGEGSLSYKECTEILDDDVMGPPQHFYGDPIYQETRNSNSSTLTKYPRVKCEVVTPGKIISANTEAQSTSPIRLQELKTSTGDNISAVNDKLAIQIYEKIDRSNAVGLLNTNFEESKSITETLKKNIEKKGVVTTTTENPYEKNELYTTTNEDSPYYIKKIKGEGDEEWDDYSQLLLDGKDEEEIIGDDYNKPKSGDGSEIPDDTFCPPGFKLDIDTGECEPDGTIGNNDDDINNDGNVDINDGDINGDGVVDSDDTSDVNGDGTVDMSDGDLNNDGRINADDDRNNDGRITLDDGDINDDGRINTDDDRDSDGDIDNDDVTYNTSVLAVINNNTPATPDTRNEIKFNNNIENRDFAQSFKNTQTGYISKFSVYIKKIGNPDNLETSLRFNSSDSTPGTIFSETIEIRKTNIRNNYSWIDVILNEPVYSRAGEILWLTVTGTANNLSTETNNNYYIIAGNKSVYTNGKARTGNVDGSADEIWIDADLVNGSTDGYFKVTISDESILN